jgi:hypothetical protein
MAATPPAPVNPTGQLAQAMPGYDAAPVIAAQEQNLQDYLNLPVQDILARLGLPPLPNGAPPGMLPPEAAPIEQAAGNVAANPMQPDSLIKPVTDALGTLGTGVFQNLDPTKMFEGISKAFESTSQSLQQAMGSLEGIWKGASGAATGAKTGAAMANGAEVGAQATGIGGSLTAATSDVKQAESRLIEIINEFHAKIEAIGPNIIFPWGQAAAVEAATQAISMTTECITELQSMLAAQGGEVAAIGAPVAVTAAPQMGAEMIGPLIQTVTGLAGPIMQAATGAMSTGIGMVTQGVQTGVQTATGLASSLGEAGSDAATAGAAPAALASKISPAGMGAGGVGGGVGGGGGGPASTMASRVEPSPMVQRETNAAATSSLSRAAAPTTGAGGAGGMMGGGAPMAGHGAGNKGGNNHNAAAFLHTSDQGDEIVGDLGTVTPAVIGGADEAEPPDVELRI